MLSSPSVPTTELIVCWATEDAMDPEVQRVGISIEVAAWTRRTLTPCGASWTSSPR